MPEAILVTISDAADMLGLSHRQVYELVNAGELGQKRYVGSRNYRLEAAAVRAYAESLPTEPPTA